MRTADLPLQLAKLALLPYGAVARERRPGVTILVYHRVGGGSGRQIDLPLDLFEWQMRYLRERCHVVALGDVVGIAEEGKSFPHDVVVITFDDGYGDVFRNAFPILRHYGLPSTVYLATAYVESGCLFPFEAALAQVRRGRSLTWDEAGEMQASGLVTFGAHTHTHPDLGSLTGAEIAEEIERGNDLIARRLGRPPLHFAYPWGRASVRAAAAVRRAYRTAVLGGTRTNPYGAIDLLALRRVPIQRSDARFFFRLKLDSYLVGEEWFRGRSVPAPRPAAPRLHAPTPP